MRAHLCRLARLALCGALAAWGCGAPEGARRAALPIRADASPLAAAVTTDLGYRVTLTRARLALRDLHFTVAGELHARAPLAPPTPLWRALRAALAALSSPSAAHAHPGHYEGGEVTGALTGYFSLDLPADDGRALGEAWLLEGEYTAVNFTFAHLSAAPRGAGGEDPSAPTIALEGVAARDGREVRFAVSVQAPEGRALVGVPFVASVSSSSAAGAEGRFALELTDPLAAGTLFDGLDFLLLDEAWDGAEDGVALLEASDPLAATDEPYLTLRRALLSHSFYRVSYQQTNTRHTQE